MSARQSNENKSLSDEVENKSLAPQVEDKAAKPAKAGEDMVAMIAAHPIAAGRIGNAEDLNPGDRFPASKQLARVLTEQGAARPE